MDEKLKNEIENEVRLCLNAAYETDYIWDGVDERKVKHFDIDWAVKLIMEKVIEKYVCGLAKV